MLTLTNAMLLPLRAQQTSLEVFEIPSNVLTRLKERSASLSGGHPKSGHVASIPVQQPQQQLMMQQPFMMQQAMMGQHVPPPNNLALVALAVTGPMSASFDQTELNQVMVGLAGAPPDVLISIVTL